jgi:ABC-type lipoprotein export system ATPase subunit
MASSATEVVLELRDVEKSFTDALGARPILHGLDLMVTRGEIVAIVGRSGSGKTTLLTLVAGLDSPDAGTVCLLEGDTSADALGWSDLAILPQSLGMLDELTLEENITLPLRLADVPRPADATDLMVHLGIDHLGDRFPNEVSLGEQQRAALARAAMVRPRLLLADEPISHQNQAWARSMMALIESMAGTGTTCVLATHNEIAFDAASRVLELRDGRLRPRPGLPERSADDAGRPPYVAR